MTYLTNTVEIQGTKAITKTIKSMLNTKGTARAATGKIGSLEILDTTKRLSPKGGVIKPTPSAVTMVMQK